MSTEKFTIVHICVDFGYDRLFEKEVAEQDFRIIPRRGDSERPLRSLCLCTGKIITSLYLGRLGYPALEKGGVDVKKTVTGFVLNNTGYCGVDLSGFVLYKSGYESV